MRDKGACSEAASESPFVESREERGTSSSLLPGGRVGTKLERVGAEDRTRITVYWGEGAEEGSQGQPCSLYNFKGRRKGFPWQRVIKCVLDGGNTMETKTQMFG